MAVLYLSSQSAFFVTDWTEETSRQCGKGGKKQDLHPVLPTSRDGPIILSERLVFALCMPID